MFFARDKKHILVFYLSQLFIQNITNQMQKLCFLLFLFILDPSFLNYEAKAGVFNSISARGQNLKNSQVARQIVQDFTFIEQYQINNVSIKNINLNRVQNFFPLIN